MSAARPPRSVHLLAWLGWSAAPVAWAALHVFGFGITQAACNAPTGARDVPVDGLAWASTIAAALVAIAGLVGALLAFRATGDADELPGERVHFMAVVGLAISPLFLAIILMDGIGTILLQNCHQG
ncbi:MAG TPA: hypothetical protein VM684_15115 [Gaiellales bacterium]|nr:hypothetical protein [Gaiellales bacterium]